MSGVNPVDGTPDACGYAQMHIHRIWSCHDDDMKTIQRSMNMTLMPLLVRIPNDIDTTSGYACSLAEAFIVGHSTDHSLR